MVNSQNENLPVKEGSREEYPVAIERGQLILFEQFSLIRRTWIWITLLAIFAGVGAFLYATYVLPVEYLSTAVAVPPNKQGSPLDDIFGGAEASLKGLGFSKLVGKGAAEDGYTRYSIMTSRSLKDSLIAKYRLFEVYEIPKERSDQIYGALDGHLDIEPTDEGPIEIAVYDVSPERAAAMANDVVYFTNQISRALVREETEPLTQYARGRYLEVTEEQEQLAEELEKFTTQYKLFNTEGQITSLTSGLIQAEANVAAQRVFYNVLREKLGDEDPLTQQAAQMLDKYEAESNRLAEGAGGKSLVLSELPTAMVKYLQLRQNYEVNAKVLALLKPLYEQSLFDQQQRDIPVLNILDAASPPPVKARPKRSLIAASGFLGTFLLAYLFIAVIAYARGFMRRYRAYTSERNAGAPAPLPEEGGRRR